jgi:hypothetical protein
MNNMSYCRFQNTRTDLDDCAEHIADFLTDKDEKRARHKLVSACVEICEAVGFTVNNDETKTGKASIEDAIASSLSDYEGSEDEEDEKE